MVCGGGGGYIKHTLHNPPHLSTQPSTPRDLKIPFEDELIL